MPEPWQELAAQRMTRTLAKKPRHHKTRAYLESLPKRKPIIVTPEDYPLITRADARSDYVLQMMRDAQRYAEWERRGKSPSPTLPRRDRLRPRARCGRDPMRGRLFAAQNGLCGVCEGPISDPCEGTIDHVIPRALGGKNAGNVLLAHYACNHAKADRHPTSRELQTLALVNDRLASLACSSMVEPSAHNGFDVSSIPTGPTSDSDTRPKDGDAKLDSTRE